MQLPTRLNTSTVGWTAVEWRSPRLQRWHLDCDQFSPCPQEEGALEKNES